MDECKYKPVERTGLYIMVIILLLWGPCGSNHEEHKQIIDRLERIEAAVK